MHDVTQDGYRLDEIAFPGTIGTIYCTQPDHLSMILTYNMARQLLRTAARKQIKLRLFFEREKFSKITLNSI